MIVSMPRAVGDNVRCSLPPPFLSLEDTVLMTQRTLEITGTTD